MRKPEQRMWDYLKDQMGRSWHAQRHEDKYCPDIPDISYGYAGMDGWLELKVLDGWPADPAKPISMPHLRSGQVNWLEDRYKHGNYSTNMLVAVGGRDGTFGDAEWFVVPGNHVRDIYEKKMTEASIRARYLVYRGRDGGLKKLLDLVLGPS
ncbi:MAG: hypothetical protein E6R08_06315 [Nevskiaceae bacterium]|nr:MAG: hypothetical protein E6R08_06315 [Nevskiaceae bacterium]